MYERFQEILEEKGLRAKDVTVDVYTRIRIEEKLNCVNRLEWLE